MIEYKGMLYDCATEEEAEAMLQLSLNPPQMTPEEIAEDNLFLLRRKRDQLIAETDWWVLPDRIPTQEQLDYRQALRDITETYSSIDSVVWPTKPE